MLSTSLPGIGPPMLMKHRDDSDALRLVHEIDRIGKLVEQSAPDIFTDDWKTKRIVGDVVETCANFTNEPSSQVRLAPFVPSSGFFDFMLIIVGTKRPPEERAQTPRAFAARRTPYQFERLLLSCNQS